MPTTPIVYMRLDRPEDVYEVDHDYNSVPYVIVSEETIEHDDYNDLRDKIRRRFKELFSLQHEPLFDLRMEYNMEDANSSLHLAFTENFTQHLYDRLDWNLQEEHESHLEAIYYTYRGTNDESSTDSVNSSDNSINSVSVQLFCGQLGCTLLKLEKALNGLVI